MKTEKRSHTHKSEAANLQKCPVSPKWTFSFSARLSLAFVPPEEMSERALALLDAVTSRRPIDVQTRRQRFLSRNGDKQEDEEDVQEG